MPDLSKRFPQNPLLTPADAAPPQPGLKVECLLNPGVFRHNGKTYLLIRTAVRPEPVEGRVTASIMEGGKLKTLEWDTKDPRLDLSDARIINYDNVGYLSTISYLTFWVSDDGIKFKPAPMEALWGLSELETFGIEDCRVTTFEDGRFFLTYTAVSGWGYGAGLRETRDWKTVTPRGMIISPSNKDVAIFERKVNGQYVCLHRPSGVIVGGHYIWMGFSENLVHWGGHVPIAKVRPGRWDSARVGAGAAPIYTEQGWLEIYHGADAKHRYCLGALLLDLKEPWKVLARSEEPIMEPSADYEVNGFFGKVIFTNGHLVDGDTVTMYYGAADSVICGAHFSIKEILKSLGR